MDGPADTRMMGIVHDALRRDLARIRAALAGAVPEARRRALAAHVGWMMDFLHEHHEGEDAGLYPMVRAVNPAVGALLDVMAADHAAVDPAVESVRRPPPAGPHPPTPTARPCSTRSPRWRTCSCRTSSARRTRRCRWCRRGSAARARKQWPEQCYPRTGASAQVGVEPVEGALPGLGGGVGVVVEAVAASLG